MNVIFIGENRPVYCSLTAATGQIVPVSGTFALYMDGVLQTGYPVATSGNDSSGETVRWWYVLNTTTILPGDYTAVFTVQMSEADGISRTIELPVELSIQLPAPLD